MPDMKQWIPLGGLLVVLMFAAPASADNRRFEVMPFGGYRVGGDFDVEDEQGVELRSADLDEDVSWGIELAYYRDRNAYYELLFSRQTSQFDDNDPALGGVDLTTDYIQFGGTLLFDSEPWILPYLSLTIGLTRFDADGFGSEYKFSGSLGTGLRLPVNDRLSFVAGIRGYGTLIDSDTELFCVSGGGQGSCVVRTSGDIFFQGEATVGVALRF
jgi:hypothetical protein